MKKAIKIILWSVLSLIVLLLAAGSLFFYKILNGFPVSYETEVPAIQIPDSQHAVLLFSKSTGFRHEESIEAGKKAFVDMASRRGWFLYSTEEGGVFNQEQLVKFDVVIFNNSTGRLLNNVQQKVVEDYVQNGGRLVGIHGAGDNSHHHWKWYEDEFIGAHFSHHALDPQLQLAEITLHNISDTTITQGLPASWTHTDEWYVFLENPKARGFEVVYTINGNNINPNGNILWMKDRNFGMGKDHPVAWFRSAGRGSTFYTSIGHGVEAWQQEPFIKMLENAVSAKGQ